ncbi:MAG TPA: SDR family oxidoreductase [Candidatus Dojkabacteria bacterium]|nr:SDR family oxidoreductase [Candidatus Dojkabacteria bacterium]
MSSVLVVGGAGYIGGITTDMLIEKGHTVTVYDNLLYENRFLKNCDFLFGDIRDTDRLLAIQKKYDHIIWLAAIVGDGACAQSPELTTEINVNSLKRFLINSKRRVIFTSTCSVYGAQNGILNEGSSTKPLSLYASTKLEAEKYVLDNDGLVFRLGTLFGIGDHFSRIRLDLVVNILTLRAMLYRKVTVFGGEQWRPIIAVKDVAGYLLESITRPYNEIYNLKYENVIILELAKRIKSVFPDIEIEQTALSFEDLRNYQVDSSKVQRDFIYKPKVSVEEEVNRMKLLFNEHRIKNVNDDIYYNTRHIESVIKNGGDGIVG